MSLKKYPKRVIETIQKILKTEYIDTFYGQEHITKIITKLYDNDISKSKKYFNWMVREIKNSLIINHENSDLIISKIKLFDKYHKQLIYSDIYKYDLLSLEYELSNIKLISNTQLKKKIFKEEIILLPINDKNYKFWLPLTLQGMQLCSRGTRWCLSEKEHYLTYIKDNKHIIIIAERKEYKNQQEKKEYEEKNLHKIAIQYFDIYNNNNEIKFWNASDTITSIFNYMPKKTIFSIKNWIKKSLYKEINKYTVYKEYSALKNIMIISNFVDDNTGLFDINKIKNNKKKFIKEIENINIFHYMNIDIAHKFALDNSLYNLCLDHIRAQYYNMSKIYYIKHYTLIKEILITRLSSMKKNKENFNIIRDFLTTK